ncbi:MAG TPA: multidrug efflux RND transporter permease subunit [Polyangiales bacterium]|nr:multidrug efflux RND transporter permease subunit [Polyangiales bacterium]
MSISDPFIRRPVATILLSAAVLLAGSAAYTILPVAPLPRVDFPTISVNAALPGASPETMATAVATPLERRFGRISGVTEITSTSSLGATSITLQFDLDRPVESAARDVQAAINAAYADLPPNLPTRPNYRKINPADAPILILSLSSPALPLSEVYDSANTVLAQKISQVSGVGQVFVGGAQQPAVRVQVDPTAAAGAGLTLDDVRATLNTSTTNRPKGVQHGPTRAVALAANDQMLTAAPYANLILKSSGDHVVRLRDIADVQDGVENTQAAAWSNGVRSVLLLVRREPGANILETIDRIKALLPELSASINPSMKLEVALDRSQTIAASFHEVERTLLLSVILVTLVVFVFLRSVRATFIPSVAVPLSLVGTFAVMWLCDFTLNNLSLMALTIATGFVVDDAIVVTENIQRCIERGMKPLKAAMQGAREIGFTIVSITVSLLAAFIPLLLMGGVVGRLFREFAVTLAVAIVLSAVVSLTLTPMLCGHLLRHREGPESKFSQLLERPWLALHASYERGLRWVLKHRGPTLLLTLAMTGLAGWLIATAPKGLFPQQDTGVLQGSIQGPQDTSFNSMRERSERVQAIVAKDPDVDHVVAFLGAGPGGNSLNTGSMFIALKNLPPRTSTPDEVIGRLRKALVRVEGVQLFLQAGQDLRVGGRQSRTQFQYTLQDASLENLKTWAPRLVDELKTMPELRDVATDQQTAGLQLDFKIDRDTAGRYGITPSQIDSALYSAFGQRQVATMYTERNQYRVVMEMKPSMRTGPEAVKLLYLRAADGGLVPLSMLGHTSPTYAATAVNHQGQFPSTTLSFNLAPGVSLGQATEAIRQAQIRVGLPSSMRAGFQGTARVFADSLKQQPLLILIALLAVYVVLGVLYESYIHPITILSTLPSAGVGAVIALRLFGIDLNLIALVGIILLIGIVKKNAIMLVDFAIEAERKEGLSAEAAIIRAASLRMRPIMMTTLAALLGAVPLMFGSGMGSELRQPLGVAIVGGLAVSQFFTMFTTPVVYLILDRFSRPKPQLEMPHVSEGVPTH